MPSPEPADELPHQPLPPLPLPASLAKTVPAEASCICMYR